jgi:sugar phosphate isomerase/epimerase
MEVLVFRALWGMTGPVSQQIERIAAAGYDGIEFWPAQFDTPLSEWLSLVKSHRLHVIVAAGVAEKEMLEPALTQLAEYQPLKINLQGGRDAMTRDEGCAFFEEALRVEAQIGIPVGHETHRGRLLYTPWETLFYLRQFDTLRITADYSHWVNVCERLPDDQSEALDAANRRAIHIHGRVGYEEGPQVPDPSAPEYARQVAWHERQWQQIGSYQQGERLTFTPEYGPPGYLHTLPHTNVPVADLWEVCLWGAKRARRLFDQNREER